MRIGIESIAGEVRGIGSLPRVWEAWMRGTNVKMDVMEGLGEWWKHTPLRIARELAKDEVGLVFASTKGDIAGEVKWMSNGNERLPTLGSEAGRLANAAGLRGPVWAVSTACSSGLVALIEAAIAITEGEAKHMLAIGADVIDGFIEQGFGALKAISPGVCRPFDRERDGLTLGSAAAGCVVAQASAKSQAVISGWGISNDATHMTAPDRHAGGLIRAMRAALAHASLPPGEIDVVFAHGTGTKYNDAMEAVAIAEVFGIRDADKKPAVTGVKGLIGHTLGAAGLIEAVLAVQMIAEGIVPGVFGLRTPEREDLDIVQTMRNMPVQHVMKIGSGFGGMNAAVILSRAGGKA